MTALDQNQPARSVELSTEEAAAVKPLYLLTMKPMVYAANVAEDDLADLGSANKHVQTMRKKAAGDSCELIIVSAQVSCIVATVSSDGLSAAHCTPQLAASMPSRVQENPYRSLHCSKP